jgi:hypothetical protein
MKQMWFEAVFRWHFLAEQEITLDLFAVLGDGDGDREVQATIWTWVRHAVAGDTRTCLQWLACDDRRALRDDARRDPISKREEAHARCRQG